MSLALILWCGLGLVGWWAFLRRTPGGLGGRVFPAEWRAGESIFAGLVGFYFLTVIMAGGGPAERITPQAIHVGVLVYAMMIGVLLAFLAARGFPPIRVFGLAPARPLRVVGIGVICFAMTYPTVLVIEAVTTLLGHSASDGDPMVRFLLEPLTAADKVWVVILAVVAAPLAEELIFRGFIYGVLKKHFGPLAAMGASALLFAAIHQNIPAIPALATLAIGFTLAYELTGSLWAPIVMHALFNSVSVVVLLFFPEWIPDV